MRLTCPNCGAQYEVPDDVIPEEGRDVQCSNCGTTWFQEHASRAGQDRPAPDMDDDLDFDDDADGEDTPPPPPVRREAAPARTVAPDAADILRQEAEYEARMRREEAGSLETQPDLGLDDAADDAERRARQARERMARLKGPGQPPAVEKPVPDATPPVPGSRRDRLPDIDEINSSLRARVEPAERPTETDPAKTQPRRSGFARGFSVSLLVVVLAGLVYANAPLIAQALPQADPAVTAYVVFVDGLRGQLDALVRPLLP